MTKAEDQVRRVLADLAEAIRDKDATAVIALLADDEVTFDLAPPLRMEPERTHDPAPLEEWFATWQDQSFPNLTASRWPAAGTSPTRSACST